MNEPAAIERKLAAVLHADVAGYSRLSRVDESGTFRALKHALELFAQQIAAYGGRVVNTAGDAVLAEFPSVVSAVACAIEVQRHFSEEAHGQSEEQRLAFRVGVNFGDVIVDGKELYGDGVNIAARLQSLAEPGGVCISQMVFEQVRGQLDAKFIDLGNRRLKNIQRPIHVYGLLPKAKHSSRVIRRGTPLIWSSAALALVVAAGIGGLSISGFWSSSSEDLQPATTFARANTSLLPSVAVLPFINLSGDPGQDYICDAITEDLISELGRFSSLVVMGANMSRPFKDTLLASHEIGQRVGVRYLVQGSLRRSGDRLRVAVQLIDAEMGRLLWSEQFDQDMRDVLVLQKTIADNVAGMLVTNLTQVEVRRAFAKPIQNLDGYELTLRSRALMRQETRSTNREARGLLEKAIAINPYDATSLGLLGQALYDMMQHGWTEFPDDVLARAESYAKRAVAADDSNLIGHRVLARIYATQLQYERALTEAERAITLNPNDAESIGIRAAVLLWMGLTTEAVTAAETEFRYDPAPSASSYLVLGLGYYLTRRYTDAVRLLEQATLRFPDYSFFLPVLAATYGQLGYSEEATRTVTRLRQLNPLFDPETFGSRLRNHDQLGFFREGLQKAGLYEKS